MKKFITIILLITFILGSYMPAYANKKDDNFVMISKNTKHLRSRLSKEYTGYVYKVKNISEEPLYIEGVTMQDNLTGEAAYLSVKRSSTALAAKRIGGGLVYALPTLTLSLIISVIIMPFEMIGNSFGNTGAKQEGKRYTSTFNPQTLKAGETVIIKTIAVHRHAPSVNILYKKANDIDYTKFEFK